MAIVIGSFFIGYPILSILSLPVFLSAMMGISFKRTKNVVRAASPEKISSRDTHPQTAH